MQDLLEILDRLIGFDSVSCNSNLPIINFIEDFLYEQGFEIIRYEDDEEAKRGILASIGPKDRPGLLLSAHTDTVPVSGQNWTKDPFRLSIEHSRAYGRGTTDMKAFAAAMMVMAGRVGAARLSAPLYLVFSYDEEIGCLGIKKMLPALQPNMRNIAACIVGEPTEMKIAIGHKGKAALRATCSGEAGHSALAPKFTNAIYVASRFIEDLQLLQKRYESEGAQDKFYDIPYTTFHVGKIFGGRVLNIVPSEAVIDFEFRHLAADRPGDIIDRLEKMAARATEIYLGKGGVQIEPVMAYPGLDMSADHDIVKKGQQLAGDPDLIKVAFGTEAGFFNQSGIPTIVCGPGSMERQGHKADEYIELSQLQECIDFLDRALAEFVL